MPKWLIILRFLIFLGIFTPLLRYTSLHFSTLTNNAIRFLSGGIFLFILFLYRYPTLKTQYSFTITPRTGILLTAFIFLSSINMTFFIKGLSLSSAFTGSLFVTFGIPLCSLIAIIIFIDEREKSLNLFFLVGMTVSIIGSIIFINQPQQQAHSAEAYMYFGVAISAQVISNNLIKQLTKSLPGFFIAMLNSLLAGSLLLTIAFFTGSLKELAHSSVLQIVILVFVGIYGTYVGGVLTFDIIQRYGITTLNILQLLTPIVVAIIAYLTMNETITFNQLIGAGVIIGGAYLSICKPKNYKKKKDQNNKNNWSDL